MSVCPVDCITYEAGDRKAYIDPDTCIGCGACVRACPQGAIFEAKRLPAAWSFFAEVDRGWFIDPDWARAAVDELAAA
jgi:ferredoxin